MTSAGKRVLIINADDLGYSRGINQAIQECSTAGMLRSATLMANGRAFDDAVATVRNNDNLCIGVHLALTELPPVSPPGKLGRLADESGFLPDNPRELMTNLLAGRISKESIWQELNSQIGKVLDYGLKPTHLDSHKHVHVIPQVLDTVIELARKFTIPWIRAPFDGASFFCLGRLMDRGHKPSFCAQFLKAKMIGAFRPTFHKHLRNSGLRSPDHFLGISLTGNWNEALVMQLLEELPTGVTEWMVHPGNCDEELEGLRTRLLQQRENERDLLLSNHLQRKLEQRGIIVSSFRQEDV